MNIRTPWMRRLGWMPVAALVIAGAASAPPALAAPSAGTTLSQTVSASAHLTKTFSWGIVKSAVPDTLTLFRGDSGTVQYTVALRKDAGAVRGWIDGQVCITNGGIVATQNLASTINVTQPPPADVIATTPLDVSANPVLAAGQTYCYGYRVDIPLANVVPGDTYKVTAKTTITNHSGHLRTPFGPSTSASVIMPENPTLVHDSVTVSDSQGGSLGTFSDGGTATYDHMFSCDADNGTNTNTATIRYADDQTTGPSASAAVAVNCYALDVSKTAHTSFTRTYTWSIKKQADVSGLTLVTGATASVNYAIDVSTSYADSNHVAAGQITVDNPAPVDATINSVADAVDGVAATTIDCGVTFPRLLPAGGSLVCDYTVDLPNASSGINTATATLQNYADGAPSGMTDFTGTALVDFGTAIINSVDAIATLSDSFPDAGLPHSVDARGTPVTYTYMRTVGPYSASGEYTVFNVATVTGIDTQQSDSSSVAIPVNVTS